MLQLIYPHQMPHLVEALYARLWHHRTALFSTGRFGMVIRRDLLSSALDAVHRLSIGQRLG